MAMRPESSGEEARLATLRSLDLLDTPGEARFDRITRMAREILDAPMATLELVDERRVWTKSSQGMAEWETPRLDSFADAVIRGSGPFLVTDARYDDRFRSHPRVSGNAGVRFYAGYPVTAGGFPLGALGVMGPHPRRLSVVQTQVLADLAALAEREVLQWRITGAQETVLRSLAPQERRLTLDPATGLWNRRGMEEVLSLEIDRAARSGSALGLILAAPEVSRPSPALLRETAERLRGALRPSDTIGRWDEGTYLILLPGWDASTTERVAHHLLAAVGGDRRPPREPVLRIGVTAAEAGRGGNPGALLEEALSALEEARLPGSGGIRVRRSRRETARFAGFELSAACAIPSVA